MPSWKETLLSSQIPDERFRATLRRGTTLHDTSGGESTQYTIKKELVMSLDDLENLKNLDGVALKVSTHVVHQANDPIDQGAGAGRIWLIGCNLVILLGYVLNLFFKKKSRTSLP